MVSGVTTLKLANLSGKHSFTYPWAWFYYETILKELIITRCSNLISPINLRVTHCIIMLCNRTHINFRSLSDSICISWNIKTGLDKVPNVRMLSNRLIYFNSLTKTQKEVFSILYSLSDNIYLFLGLKTLRTKSLKWRYLGIRSFTVLLDCCVDLHCRFSLRVPVSQDSSH